MKNILYKFTALAAAALAAAACTDLDTMPAGDKVTPDQKEEATRKDPDLISAEIAALNATLIYTGSDDNNQHHDYGFPSMCIMMDANGMDMPSIAGGYNWYYPTTEFMRDYDEFETLLIYQTFYKYILAANNILSTVPFAGDDPVLKQARGYGFAARAWAYLNLVQLYQFNYQAAKDKPAVPIVTESMSIDQINANPRKTVDEVYDFLMTDLDSALVLLQSAAPRPDKSYIDHSVALGIRARANLAMGRWAEAASDAAAARQGYPLLTLAEVGKPGFHDQSVASCMWAAIISESNRCVTTGIVNWPSHLCSLTGSGYAVQVGAWRKINILLFDAIPASDVRKGWWVDGNLSSPIADQLTFGGMPVAAAYGYEPYTNVKFGPYQDVIGNPVNSQDWIMMRAEEMLLIEAEGLAMSGDVGGAKSLLEGWLKPNRDPAYTCSASTPEEMQNEIWKQRRIELWGEGFGWFDLMRLQRNLVRFTGSKNNFPDEHKFNVAAGDPILLWLIPQDEITANDGIDPSQNNPIGAKPNPGAGAGLTDGCIVK